MEIQAATFYRFVELTGLAEWKSQMIEAGLSENIRGTILLAEEGINATIAGNPHNIQSFLSFLHTFNELKGLNARFTDCTDWPFKKLKVRIKKEIITLKSKVNPLRATGIHVSPQEWNQLIASPDTFVLDTRNNYEVKLGSFRGAIDPNLKTFSDFRSFAKTQLQARKSQKIAMYCTGGIRCEKASAYLIELGFDQVYQLDGGIIQYQLQMPTEESLFEGQNFVFDERIAL